MNVCPPEQPAKYVRRRKQDRPVCSICGKGYRAGSTRGMVTYYYPDCDCPCENKKKMRSRKPGN
jgi:hypothetical protein